MFRKIVTFHKIILILFTISLPLLSKATENESNGSCLKERKINETFAQRENICYKRALHESELRLKHIVEKIEDSFSRNLLSEHNHQTKITILQRQKIFHQCQSNFNLWIQQHFKEECEIYGARSYSYCFLNIKKQYIDLRIKYLEEYFQDHF